MDVESNNIANVNTIGFKYSRANFADLLAQTNKIATAPQGDLGGKNALQVGLGTSINSVTRIHSQGSIQNTDKNTDVAIQGDGFFIVSQDGGNTYKYSRNGDFKFDAIGNFVDNNGFIVQGWLRDEETGLVDATAPIQDIQIPPGLTTPASATTEVTVKANLNSGDIVEQYSPIYSLDTDSADNDGPDGLPNTLDDDRPENFNVLYDASGRALNMQDGEGMWFSFAQSTVGQTLTPVVAATSGAIDINGTSINVSIPAGSTAAQTVSLIAGAINTNTANTGVSAAPDPSDATRIILTNDNAQGTTSATKNIALTVPAAITAATGLTSSTQITAFQYTFAAAGAAPVNELSATTTVRQFTTTEDLREQLQLDARLIGDDLGDNDDILDENAITVGINARGQFEITNNLGADGTDADATSDEDYDLRITITGLTAPGVAENVRFAQNMQTLSGALPVGSTTTKLSQSFNAAVHSSSIDVFDSLGSKHTLRMDFRKTAITSTGGTEWTYEISVPSPGDIGGTIADNILVNQDAGRITFTNTGALANYTIPSLTYTANNGSAPNQTINLNFGTVNDFDGITSFDRPSATSGISQDGYPGGDLVGIRIDQSGTLIGSFSNGRSFGLAQISMAKFANNEGLVSDGGNVYLQSANSGDPIVGTASTAGRGFIQSSALEASNVDLSKSLTQLIIIQRGYQANGKTITTSDTLLETLIGLKR